ncbi:MAG: ACT domain-containing protein [Sedimentisphaerales bacterium]|nr:ACT domain-containing protein [Sedimentisphaerales bacterium]
MHLDTQFSIFMVNKPGVLARVLNTLAVAKINIVAMTMMDSAEHGVMRLVGSSHQRVREVLTQLNMQFSETDVLCVNLPNKAGALADITAKLASSHINIAYAYVTAGARGGRTTGILKVADVKKAMKVLQGDAELQHKEDSVRRPPSSRR